MLIAIQALKVNDLSKHKFIIFLDISITSTKVYMLYTLLRNLLKGDCLQKKVMMQRVTYSLDRSLKTSHTHEIDKKRERKVFKLKEEAEFWHDAFQEPLLTIRDSTAKGDNVMYVCR